VGERRGAVSFIAGLLHDIGKLIFHLSDPVGFASLGYFDEAGEKDLFGATHPVAGAYVVETWGLESEVAKAILEHHVRPVYPGLAGRVAKADWIAHRIGFGSVPTEIEPAEAIDDGSIDLPAVADRVAKAFDAEQAFFR
jgi:HD-like signal output (HDOD) protein